ncbi:hypothetical protein LOTGIDRAFT_155044 [Lottia gigantea]|uniref:DNA-directed DNA polymerase n=1 Tax=Lottia gigantea TaxID=225164 RepID=V3Z4F7_LOTGI|nr:hypothetical protein LOTGIDRAFT_155044 [Lottia gigantea]ESO85558.1 hypothetical protein LOTGIDRAFT_155044 [Lottia gigantea]
MKVTEELDWVFYLHKEHFCLIRRNNKTLGIKEIEDNYDENVWRTCIDDKTVTQVSPLKLNVFPTIHDDCLYAWDCETYNENKAIPYSCTLVNLEKLRKMFNRINNLFPNLKPTDPIPEEFYNKLMTNIVEIFVGTDCIDQMLQLLGKIDQKRITLIAHNASGFDNWIMIKNVKKLTQCPLKMPRGILSLPLTSSFTDEDLQKKWKRQKEIKDNWESLRHEWEPYAKRDTLCLGACLKKYNQAMKKTVFQNVSNNLTAPSLSLKGWYYLYHYDKEMVEEEWYETTRMVPKHTEKENVEKVYSHTHPFIRYFIRQSIKGGRVSANRKSFETNKMDEICNVLKEYTELESNNIIDLFKEYCVNPKDKTEVHAKLKELEYSKLMAFDTNGLYASAMTEGEYPKAESARAFRLEENEKFVKLFNEQNSDLELLF